MKILKTLSVYTLCAMLVCMPMSCVGPMSPAQGNALKTEISAQIDAGEVSEELGLFLIAEINKRMDPNYSGGIDWDSILASGGGILLAAVSAYTGVRITRGPAKPMDKSQASILEDLIAEYKAKQGGGEEQA